jgi:hypothetical protein
LFRKPDLRARTHPIGPSRRSSIGLSGATTIDAFQGPRQVEAGPKCIDAALELVSLNDERREL